MFCFEFNERLVFFLAIFPNWQFFCTFEAVMTSIPIDFRKLIFLFSEKFQGFGMFSLKNLSWIRKSPCCHEKVSHGEQKNLFSSCVIMNILFSKNWEICRIHCVLQNSLKNWNFQSLNSNSETCIYLSFFRLSDLRSFSSERVQG